MEKFDLMPLGEMRKNLYSTNRFMDKGIKGIYFLFDIDKNLLYIGQSNDIRKRIYEHKSKLNILFTYFYYIEYYGTKRDLLDREGLYIWKYMDEGIENIKFDLMGIFIEKRKGIKKTSTVCYVSRRRAERYLRNLTIFELFGKKVYLKTELKKALQKLDEKGLAFIYDVDSI